jgi:signal transduction histidine kinase
MIESLYLSFVLLTGAVSAGVAAFAWRSRDQAGARPLVVFALAASVWTLSEGLVMAQSGLDAMGLWTRVGLSVSVLIPAAWLAFALEYTGERRALTRRTLGALALEPLVFWLFLWTNDSHELVYSATETAAYGDLTGLVVEFEVAFWGHLTYAYLLFAAGALLVVRMLVGSNQAYRWQATSVLLAVVVPMVTHALSSFGVLLAGLTFSGQSFVLAALVLGVVVLQQELLAVAPATREIGRERVLTDLDDAIFILDDSDRIVDANPAGERLLDGPLESQLGRPLTEVRPELAEAIDEGGRPQIQLDRGGKHRTYDVRTSTLGDGFGAFSGRVLSLRDVTERRQREQRLDVLNRLLRHNIRNELNLARGKIELAEMDVDDPAATERLAEATAAINGIVSRSDKLGRLSRILDAEEDDVIDLAAELRRERATSGLVSSGGSLALALPETLWVAGGSSLVVAVGELVENAIEHNDAEDPQVTVGVDETASDETHVVLTVSDNGPGLAAQELETLDAGEETPLQHSSGVGLWLVTWVVERVGGTVSFETDDGTTVRLRLPRGQPQKVGE